MFRYLCVGVLGFDRGIQCLARAAQVGPVGVQIAGVVGAFWHVQQGWREGGARIRSAAQTAAATACQPAPDASACGEWSGKTRLGPAGVLHRSTFHRPRTGAD